MRFFRKFYDVSVYEKFLAVRFFREFWQKRSVFRAYLQRRSRKSLSQYLV